MTMITFSFLTKLIKQFSNYNELFILCYFVNTFLKIIFIFIVIFKLIKKKKIYYYLLLLNLNM